MLALLVQSAAAANEPPLACTTDEMHVNGVVTCDDAGLLREKLTYNLTAFNSLGG